MHIAVLCYVVGARESGCIARSEEGKNFAFRTYLGCEAFSEVSRGPQCAIYELFHILYRKLVSSD